MLSRVVEASVAAPTGKKSDRNILRTMKKKKKKKWSCGVGREWREDEIVFYEYSSTVCEAINFPELFGTASFVGVS